MADEKSFTLWMPARLLALVKDAAAVSDQSASRWVREAIREKLERDATP